MTFLSHKEEDVVRYSLDQYDAHGFLKAPIILWVGWMFLVRSWVVFAMAGVSRDSGSKLLAIVYPDSSTLYLGLAMGIPSLLLMWLMGLRHPDRGWVNRITRYGREITLILCGIQLAQTMYHVYLEHGVFNWANALTITLLAWFMIYLLNGRWVKDCFHVPQLAHDEQQHSKN
ncbi:Inner membrane protein YfeZ [Vibrio alginolyticus]|uniref:Inner membrane protein YfeZ n=1 Tax=Vibrio alginolyticus TaxID=663 RepID=A0A1W6W906_VIBAL|nr:Inner membrane protein YfeZ [Vibrio alginolyticus]ARP03936.1 Inner membrane protein YfeZ [Vibrio alginolyticus]ARP08994.1 Inner membrane protein YfeZ [Vibrio alginolyticus]ARP14071.1 Inner membrane protein YfeZ [Vibrio alginolyticus]ARP19130.1 Inner membrane protein YfeZ [Vibrio alginolyticus]